MTRRALWITAGVLAFAILVVACLWLLPPSPLSDADLHGIPAEQQVQLRQDQDRLRNDVRGTILQAVAGLLVIGGALGTVWQVQINREGQVTDRFSRAVDQLGSANADVRIGGLYALERIAKNSRADRTAVQFMLGGFVRNNAKWAGPNPTAAVEERGWLGEYQPDVQAAVNILGRRPPTEFRVETSLYLSRVDLRGVQLHRGRLSHTQLRHANLARAYLKEAVLDGSDLSGTDLRGANLAGASLVNTVLRGAYLAGANLTDADLAGADLTDVHADDTTCWPAGYLAS